MKKKYVAPIVEKVTFDYKVQTSGAGSTSCFGSVMNVSEGPVECASGTPVYWGWNLKNPGEI